MVLRTSKGLGDFSIDEFPPSWSFHLGIPATFGNPDVRLLSNGFLINFPGIAVDARIDGLLAERDLLVGETSLDLAPSLFSAEHAVEDDTNLSTLTTDRYAVALRLDPQGSMTRFCLSITTDGLDAARARAEEGLTMDVSTLVGAELDRRSSYWRTNKETGRSQWVQVGAFERLVYALEAPVPPHLQHPWATESLQADPVLETNLTYPLVRIWSEIDPTISWAILRDVLDAQAEDGALPCRISPTDGPCFSHAPWPLFAAAAHGIGRADHGSVRDILPPLQKYLTWAISLFDPAGTGCLSWRSPEESLVPETYDQNVVSAGLTGLMLRELDCFFELHELVFDSQSDVAHLSSARERIARHLTESMWDQDSGLFRDHYLDGRPISRMTISGVFPLLWDNLPEAFVEPLLSTLREETSLGGEDGIPAWQQWENDPESPPIVPSHHVLLLDKLTELDRPFATSLASKVIDPITESMDRGAGFPGDLQARGWKSTPNKSRQDSLACACLAMLAFAATHRRFAHIPTSRVTRFMDKHITGSVITLAGLALILVGLVGFFTGGFGPKQGQETSVPQLAIANQMLSAGQFEKAAELGDQLEGQVDADILAFFRSNLLFLQGDYQAAESGYRALLQSGFHDKGKAHINLSLCLFRQNRLDEAIDEYEQVIAAFKDENPDIASQAKIALNILLEHKGTLKSPRPSRTLSTPGSSTAANP